MNALLRGLALLLLAVWLVPGFGLIDLTVSWDPEWPVMLEAGWGMFVSVGIGLPLLVAAITPRHAAACLVQLTVVTGSLAVGAVVGNEPTSWWMFLLLGLSLAVVAGLRHRQPVAPRRDDSRSMPLLLLGAAAVPFAIRYAWEMADLNRQALPTGDITNDVDHYAVQAALALSVAVLPIVAGWWPRTAPLLASSAALMAGYCGLVSYSWPGADAGVGRPSSLVLMLWAGVVLLAAWWPRRLPIASQVT